MATYKIITDSACDLSKEMLEELDVTTAPLSVLFRGENLTDSVEDAVLQKVYSGLRQGEAASTCAVNPEVWRGVMEPALSRGFDLLVLAFSSGLSTTCTSAHMAAGELREKYPQRRILVVDTLCAALGQGLLVYHACRKRDEGLGLQALRNWVEDNKHRLCHWFTVEDLKYLKRGGRISAATAVLGTMLNIKPVLRVDDEGHLVSHEKARGRKAAIASLAEKPASVRRDWRGETMFLCHGDCPEDARLLAQLVTERYGAKVITGNLGAVIGSHSGPGTLALFFLGERR